MTTSEALELADLFDRGGTTNALHRAAAAELRRLYGLNQRLVAGAKELGASQDVAEWDAAWSKLFGIIQESK